MKFLVDTHLLLWAAAQPKRLSKEAKQLLSNPEHNLLFSAASIWEIAIKSSLGRTDFTVDARQFRRGLVDNGYHDLPISSVHASAIDALDHAHRDPFDRMLVAQATVEGIVLITSDRVLGRCGGPIRMV